VRRRRQRRRPQQQQQWQQQQRLWQRRRRLARRLPPSPPSASPLLLLPPSPTWCRLRSRTRRCRADRHRMRARARLGARRAGGACAPFFRAALLRVRRHSRANVDSCLVYLSCSDTTHLFRDPRPPSKRDPTGADAVTPKRTHAGSADSVALPVYRCPAIDGTRLRRAQNVAPQPRDAAIYGRRCFRACGSGSLVKRSSSVERKCFPVLPVITFDADGALPAASAAPDTLSGGNKSGTGRKPILTCANARGHTCGRTQVGAPRGDEVLVQPGFSGEQQRAAHVGMPFDLCLLHSCY
jgi:hypothetical protein